MATKKKSLLAAAGNAGGGSDTLLIPTNNVGLNQITLTEINAVDGEVGSKTIQLQSKTLSGYLFSPVSYDGTTMAVVEYVDNTSSSKTIRVYKIDLSNGLAAATASDYFDFTGNYNLNNPHLSPNGSRIGFTHVNNYVYVYDVSTWSSPSQVTSVTYNQFGFGPRSITCVSPNGTFLCYAASDQGISIYENGSSYTAINQDWSGWNQSSAGFNYDGSYNFYWGSPANTNYTPITHRFAYNSTSDTSMGKRAYNGNLNSIHWGEADDGNSYIFTNDLYSTDNKTRRNFQIYDYVSNSLIYEDSTTYFLSSFPGGKVLVYDSGTGLYDAGADKIVLDINDSYADVTSDYHTDFITNYNGKSLWWKDGYHSINSSY